MFSQKISDSVYIALEEEYRHRLSWRDGKYVLGGAESNQNITTKDIASYFYNLGFKKFQVISEQNKKHSIESIKSIAADVDIVAGGHITSLELAEKCIAWGADYVVIGRYLVDHQQDIPAFINKLGSHLIISVDDNRGRLKNSHKIDTLEYVSILSRHSPINVLLVDDAKKLKSVGINPELLRNMQTRLPAATIWYAGGISGPKDIQTLKNEGVSNLIVGTYAYNDPATLRSL